MTHPLTPREKVDCVACEGRPAPENSPCAVCGRTALASGSGDHAELARLAEWRDRLRTDPGRAAHFGSPYADKPMQNGRTYWNIDLADDITSLLAENAALRAKSDSRAKADAKELCGLYARANEAERALSEYRIAADLLVSSLKSDLAEAERKLAEAVGLLREALSEMDRRVITAETANRIDYFLSKEAERG